MRRLALYSAGIVLSLASLGALSIMAILPIAFLLSIKNSIKKWRSPWAKQ